MPTLSIMQAGQNNDDHDHDHDDDDYDNDINMYPVFNALLNMISYTCWQKFI